MEENFGLDPEYHYTVKELAFRWNMSDDSIRRLFEREPGVLIFKIQQTGKRNYRPMRIPGTVAIRVRRRMTVMSKAS